MNLRLLGWPLKSLSSQLKALFYVIVFFACIQGALTIYAYRQVYYLEQKSVVAGKILVEFVDIGGNKQRLKVWLAQTLLAEAPPESQKIELFQKIENSLQQIHNLLKEDQDLLGYINVKDFNEISELEAQRQNLKALEVNILSLKFEMIQNPVADRIKKVQSNQLIWEYLIEVFDSLEGRDLKRLLNNAVELQQKRFNRLEEYTREQINIFSYVVYTFTASIVLVVLLFVYSIIKSLQTPLKNLSDSAIRISAGDYSTRVQTTDESELGQLGVNFNVMADELEKAKKLENTNRERIEQLVLARTAELQDAINQLRKTEEERKNFLKNISHELRTPATTIIGEAEVTLRQKNLSPEEFKNTITNIHNTAKQLSFRIEDLLALAYEREEHFSLSLQAVSDTELVTLITETVSILGNELKDRLVLDSGSKKFTCYVDLKRMTQLFLILFENAMKYSPSKSPIDICLSEETDFYLIQIKNLALFAGEIDSNQLFTRFQRTDSSKMLKPDGLGIGLSIAKQIVDAHSAIIEAKVLDGTHFAVTIKLRKPEVV